MRFLLISSFFLIIRGIGLRILGEFGSSEEEFTRCYEHELLGCAGLLSSCAIC